MIRIDEMKTGDIVHVTRDGKQYDAFIVEVYDKYNLFYGKVLPSSKDKVATATWERYGLEGDGICQPLNECANVEIISHPEVIDLEEVNNTHLYKNTIPGTKSSLMFCLTEDYGGWSESSNEDEAILESCSRANSRREGGSKNG